MATADSATFGTHLREKPCIMTMLKQLYVMNPSEDGQVSAFCHAEDNNIVFAQSFSHKCKS